MRFFRHALLSLAALVFLFEVWLWDILSAFWRWLAGFPVFQQAKNSMVRMVDRMQAHAALLLFAIPVGLLFPFKLAALWLLAQGKIVLGGIVFMLAKAAGMGSAAFLFELTRPKLMTIGWFVHLYELVMQLRSWTHRLVDPYLDPVRQRMRDLKQRFLEALWAKGTARRGILSRLRARMRQRSRG